MFGYVHIQYIYLYMIGGVHIYSIYIYFAEKIFHNSFSYFISFSFGSSWRDSVQWVEYMSKDENLPKMNTTLHNISFSIFHHLYIHSYLASYMTSSSVQFEDFPIRLIVCVCVCTKRIIQNVRRGMRWNGEDAAAVKERRKKMLDKL